MIVAGWMLANAAQATETLELLAVAQGNFDCTGVPGQANLYGYGDQLIVEFTLGYTTGRAFGAASGATIAFVPGARGCDDLLVTNDVGETHRVSASDRADTLAAAARGAGDATPDVNVVVARLGNRDDLVFGGRLHLCDWDNYCWDDGCSDACQVQTFVSESCGTINGHVIYCGSWQCTSWDGSCF